MIDDAVWRVWAAGGATVALAAGLAALLTWAVWGCAGLLTAALGRAVMLQGTASHAGKTVLAAALCRMYARRGFRVAPFKAQNMALNSFVTDDGGEMGRAQVYQARAAGLEPHVDMNPVLLKPSAGETSQVVVMGSPSGT